MDDMKFESKFATGVASKLVKRGIANKFGYDVELCINHFRTTVIEGKTHVHLDLDAEMTQEELNKLLKRIGL